MKNILFFFFFNSIGRLPITHLHAPMGVGYNQLTYQLYSIASTVTPSTSSITPIKSYSNAESMKTIILNENKDLSGIYQWVNNLDGMSNIGSAADLQKRLEGHYNSCERNKLLKRVESFKSNIRLQRAIKKYGLENFSINVLEHVSAGELQNLTTREQFYMDKVSKEMGYNIFPTAGTALGFKHSDATRKKMSATHLGKTISDKTREKINPYGLEVVKIIICLVKLIPWKQGKK